MISVTQALETVLAQVRPVEAERAPLARAARRILAEDVFADLDMPPFNKACVDGYACRRNDLQKPLRLLGTVAAGSVPDTVVGPEECVKIMTGAMMPEGAECVFMVEQSEVLGDGRIAFTGDHTKENVAPRGLDVKAGDRLLQEGHRILPQDVAVLAAMGYHAPFVARQPRVGVIATGDELVEPEVTPAPSQIRNSNSHALAALIEETGALPAYGGIAADTAEALEGALAAARAHNEVICFSGGVSMGDFDFVPGILRDHGFELLFEKVAVQPGKPTLFAVAGDCVCFGLPGNPVSTFVTFELLVRPFLLKMMGHHYAPPNVIMPLAKPVTREATRREAWIPVVLTEEGTVARVDYHGSAHFNALSHADGLIRIPDGVAELPEGERVPVRLIRR
jgi:molybdopterin molybdotransferase